jgi:hypothetical protein
MTPELATGASGYTQFKALHRSFLDLNITSIECVVLDRKRAATWIKRKHYKGIGGMGVVAWNAVATARSDASEGRFSRWMTALAYLENHGVDAEDIRDSIASKTTTVERVLSSAYISATLGLLFGKDGTLTSENGDAAAAVILIQALMEAMSDRKFVETLVSNADQQQTFLKPFAGMSVKKPSVQSNPGTSDGANMPQSGNMNSGTSGRSPSGGANGSGRAIPAGLSSGATRSKPVNLRKKLAKPGLRISNQPLNKFYSELRALDVEKNPHISAAIIRVFVEKSSAFFLETMNIPALKPGASWHDYGANFKDKVSSTLKSIDPSGANAELNYARDVSNGNRDKLHTADHLNQAIHSHLSLPSHLEIINIWDRFHPYLWALFEAIEKMHAKP